MLDENPYDYDNPTSSEMFFGRHAQVARILDGLTGRVSRSYAVLGGRRFGKTSLLRAIERQMSDKGRTIGSDQFLPLYLDLHREILNSREAFFRFLLKNITERAAILARTPPVDNVYIRDLVTRITFESDPVGEFVTGLSYLRGVLMANGVDARVVLLIDESERLLRLEYSTELLSNLRSLLSNTPETQGVLRVVMGGSTGLSSITEVGSPLMNILNLELLEPLDDSATYSLIDEPTNGLLPKATAAAVYSETGGHPCLTQYIMWHLWQKGVEQASVQDVNEACEELIETKILFDEWLEDVGHLAQLCYGSLLKAEEPLSIVHIAEELGVPAHSVRKALNVLAYHGFVKNNHLRTAERRKTWQRNGRMFESWFRDYVMPLNSAPKQYEVSQDQQSNLKLDLYSLLVTVFDINELRDLCFRLGIDYEFFPADKQGFVRELVRYGERRGILLEIREEVLRQRPQSRI